MRGKGRHGAASAEAQVDILSPKTCTHARAGQFGAVNRVVNAWDIYRRYPFTICGGVLLAAAPFLSKGN